MKFSKKRLQMLIKEELSAVLKESSTNQLAFSAVVELQNIEALPNVDPKVQKHVSDAIRLLKKIYV